MPLAFQATNCSPYDTIRWREMRTSCHCCTTFAARWSFARTSPTWTGSASMVEATWSAVWWTKTPLRTRSWARCKVRYFPPCEFFPFNSDVSGVFEFKLIYPRQTMQTNLSSKTINSPREGVRMLMPWGRVLTICSTMPLVPNTSSKTTFRD